ncbi:(deoxy)nucleoside triphosphate pyrophosphohydrolase [Microbacterium sp. 22303]|uniref:(deoxy)nucleoside triphosphate pyrophosphohydrolase n=1 Tax=Microbacterium sp. 22303 TaxID=3453905 RepID=UPI003F85F9C1
MKKQIEVVGAVLIRDGAVLSAQRSPHMSLAGFWEFPGGKVEAGETPQVALAREMREELLCTVTIGDHIDTIRHEYNFGVVTLTTFYATLVEGEPQLTEHSELRWIPVPDLLNVEWADADVPTVKRVMRDRTPRPSEEMHNS